MRTILFYVFTIYTMDEKTTGIQNERNMPAKEARNCIKENAEEQKKIVDFAWDKYKEWLAKVFREANHNNPKLQQAKKINTETLETIRNYAVAKLNKKPEELTLEEWQQAVKDFYEENKSDDSKRNIHDNPKEKGKESRELPAWLPDYVYEVDRNFKNETWDDRNPEIMKRIDEVVLKMREKGIIKTESKDWWVYTTIKFPRKKAIHFLEPDLSRYSDDEYKNRWDWSFWWEKNIHKDEVKLWWMRWNVNEWENEKLKQYVKQKNKKNRLYLLDESIFDKFMEKLENFVNQEYSLDPGRQCMDLFFRAMNSIWFFWLWYYYDLHSCFDYWAGDCSMGSIYQDWNVSASFFLTDYKG